MPKCLHQAGLPSLNHPGALDQDCRLSINRMSRVLDSEQNGTVRAMQGKARMICDGHTACGQSSMWGLVAGEERAILLINSYL